MKNHFLKSTLSFLCLTMLFNACKKEDPLPVNENELITTMVYSLITADSTDGKPTDIANFVFRDLDGDGPNAPVLIKDTLLANKTYYGVISLLNESVSPAENITNEVKEEGVDHQFFFQKTGANTLSVAYNPLGNDENGKPIGIITTLLSGTPGSGNLKITLRHQPNKSADGVESGDITNAGGETDVEISFPIEIK